MLELVKSAIEGRTTISLDYYPGARTVEPHALGYSASGDVLLRAYQTSGASESGENVNWKLFRLDRAGSVSDGGSSFAGPRPEYRRGDKAMKGGIIAQL
jgi:predicted DNA-binding transcriptional regulator YafY